MTGNLQNGKGSDLKVNVDAMHDALRAVYDLLDTAKALGTVYYMTLDTAKGIKDGKLFGDKITAAIHERFLFKEVKSSLKSQLDYWQDRKISEPYEITDDFIRFSYKGVPIEIKILKRRYKFFDNPEAITYNFDDFLLANPFSKYWPARFIVR